MSPQQKLLIASIRLVRALVERCLDSYTTRRLEVDPLSMQLDIGITAADTRVHAWLQVVDSKYLQSRLFTRQTRLRTEALPRVLQS